jgi:D-alanine-D-alanine ligase
LSDKIVIMHQRVRPGSGKDEEDTLAQAAFVEETLRDAGLKTQRLQVDLNLERARKRLSVIKPAIVFNLVESLDGRGEFIHYAAGLLESLTIPFTGSSAQALFTSSQKLLAKEIMRRAGLRTPDWFTVGNNDVPEGETTFPCIRKSVWEHASLCMDDDAVIPTEENFRQRAPRPGFYYERFIDGREFNIALLEVNGRPRPLPPVEISFVDFPPDKPKIVGYRAKWESDSFEYVNTIHRIDFPESDKPLLAEMEMTALACWELFDLSGYARVDFRVDGDNTPWVLEINANPCLMPDAGFYKTALRAGFDRKIMIEMIVAAAHTNAGRE